FLADESFSGDVIRALQRRMPTIDLWTVWDANLNQTPDPEILQWAADEDRIVLTSDKNTMLGYAYARVEAHLPMPGVFYAKHQAEMGPVILDLLLIAQVSELPNGPTGLCICRCERSNPLRPRVHEDVVVARDDQVSDLVNL